MATVSLVVKKRSAKADGLTPVYLQYLFDHDNRTLIQTGIRIPVNSWDARRRKVKDNLPANFEQTSAEINVVLSSLELRLKKLYTQTLMADVTPTIAYIRKHFSITDDTEPTMLKKSQKL